jgi:undecaprenyl-diphosphatase
MRFPRHARPFIRWFRDREPVVLAALLVLALGTWAFVKLAGEVVEGDTRAFDLWMVRAMRQPDNPAEPIGPRLVRISARDLTGLGGIAVLALMTAAVCGYLWLDGKHRLMGLVLVATLGSAVILSLMKAVFDRPRPSIVPHLVEEVSQSFPSGHSFMSATVYLTLGALLAAGVPRRAQKLYVLTVAVVLTVLVGVTRVYLGVHYPTDVIAGWTVGLVWALLCWLVAHWLQRRGQVESDEPADDD